MDSKIVFVALVLIASFALPTLATFEKDFISAEAVRAILEKTNANGMLSEDAISALTGKTVISNVVLEEALLMNLDHGVKGSSCGETCAFIPCISWGCSCEFRGALKYCFKNSIDMYCV